MIFNNEDISDNKADAEVGMHQIIDVSNDKVISRMWNVTPNGETYFYESFTFEKGKGLVSYRIGFRSERDILELNNFSKQK